MRENNICVVFYCDSYRSCQKVESEKNRNLFRRIWLKGRTLSNSSKEEVDDIFSHRNSYERAFLKDKSPHDLFYLEYKPIMISDLNVMKETYRDIRIKGNKTWRYEKQ